MSYHGDLLYQARFLARHERRRPKQSSLRRATSAAYYGIFHLLVDAGARYVVGSRMPPLRACVARAFVHSEMKDVATEVARGRWPRTLERAVQMVPISRELRFVARAFVDLQQERHEADYDLSRQFTRQEVVDRIEQVERAHREWDRIKDTDEAKIFLVGLLLNRRIRN